jgi:hypothetical protein
MSGTGFSRAAGGAPQHVAADGQGAADPRGQALAAVYSYLRQIARRANAEIASGKAATATTPIGTHTGRR